MREIGGYFELELPECQSDFPHSNGILTNSGRHALEYILLSQQNNITKIWIPYYTCDVVLQPIKRLGLDYDLYNVNTNLEIEKIPTLKDREYLLVNNYFGIKDKYIFSLVSKYRSQLIIDNSQAWYAKELSDTNCFYSPRKFFGIPDGGIAFTTNNIKLNLAQDYSSQRCSHLLKRIDKNASEGYLDFHNNSKTLTTESIKRMSKLSNRILSSVDYKRIKAIRKQNYQFLHEALSKTNLLRLPSMYSFECPMVYPYMTKDSSLRKQLIDNKVFVATYWPNVKNWCEQGSVERHLAEYIIPLPIDQRYGKEDMEKIISLINK